MHQPIPLVARIDNSQSVFYHFSGPLITIKNKIQYENLRKYVLNYKAIKAVFNALVNFMPHPRVVWRRPPLRIE